MSYLIHIRTFLQIYRSKSITKAAKHLGITQPAASMHVQALESLMGKELFKRMPRGVLPTEAAAELARSVAPYLDALENKVESLKRGNARGGTVHIIGPPDFIHFKLCPHFPSLTQEGYRLRVSTGNKSKIYEMLDSGSVDFAITASLPDEHSHGYINLLTERMLLVYSPFCFADLGSDPRAEDLLKVPLIAYDEDLPLVRTVWASMYQSPLVIQAVVTIPDFRVILKMVLAGAGWTVLPDFICADLIENGALISPTIVSSAPRNELYLVWNAQSLISPSIIYARDRIVEMFRDRKVR